MTESPGGRAVMQHAGGANPTFAEPTQGRVPRSSALLLLETFVVLLAALPARLIIGPVGAFGSPAYLAGLGCFGLWASSALQPGLLARNVLTLRIALAVLWIPGLISFAVMHLNSVETDEVNAADRWLLYMLVWSGVALLVAEALADREELWRLTRVAVAGAAFSSFVGIAQARVGFDLTTYMAKIPGLSVAGELDSVLSRSGLRRPAGTATHPIEFGCVLSMALGPALVLAIHDVQWSRVRRFGALGLIAAGVPMAVSRSAILTAAIAAGFWFAGADRARRIQGAVVSSFFVVAIFLTVPGLLGTIRSYFLNASTDTSISTRTDDYAAVTHFIRKSPVIGRGPATFLPKFRILDNQWLAQLIETGVLGALALLFYCTLPALFGGSIRRVSADPLVRAMGMALMGISTIVIVSAFTFDFSSFPMAPGYLAFYTGAAAALWALRGDGSTRVTEPRTDAAVPLT